MPYQSREYLPDSVKNHLPSHAQDLYLKAFNNAWHEYADPSKRRDAGSSLDAVCARVAWTAVKKEYEKNEETSQWIKKEELL